MLIQWVRPVHRKQDCGSTYKAENLHTALASGFMNLTDLDRVGRVGEREERGRGDTQQPRHRVGTISRMSHESVSARWRWEEGREGWRWEMGDGRWEMGDGLLSGCLVTHADRLLMYVFMCSCVHVFMCSCVHVCRRWAG